jgi:hypothetical protein
MQNNPAESLFVTERFSTERSIDGVVAAGTTTVNMAVPEFPAPSDAEHASMLEPTGK